MDTNEQNNRLAAKADKSTEEQQNLPEKANTTQGGQVDPSEEGQASEKRVVSQARRAEQPEPGTKAATKKENQTNSDSSEMINNTGDDANASDADAATG